MYWTDTGTRTIERASMDGTSRTVLHDTDLLTPYTLTVDYETQTLYWADYSLNRIEKSNVNGSDRVLLTTNVRDPYAMTFLNGSLYWLDSYYNSIRTTSLTSPNDVTTLIHLGTDGYGIQAISEQRQLLPDCKLL